MHRHMGFVWVCVLLIIGVTAPLAAQTDDGPRLNIPILLDGDTFVDSFSGDVGTRLYAFNASEGDEVTISMVQLHDDLDPFLVLLGPRGELIAADDDSGSEPFSAMVSQVKLPASGGYFLMATSYQNIDDLIEVETQDVLEYELSIEGITPPASLPDFDENRLTYFRQELQIGDVVNGESTPEEPVYYFTFDGEAGKSIDLTLTSDDFDTILHVFDPTGNRIAVNDDDPDGTGTDSGIYDLKIPDNGQYLIFATDLFFYSPGIADSELQFYGGDFTISLTSAAGRLR